MANYCGFTRTNYFRVTDAARLRAIIDHAVLGEDHLDLFTRQADGETYYGFGCYDSISGLCPNWDSSDAPSDGEDALDDENASFELFETELQKIIVPGDAIIITEVGYEKLRYLVAYSCVITRDSMDCVNLQQCSIDKAQELLQNPDWSTTSEY